MPAEPLTDLDRLHALLDDDTPWQITVVSSTGSTNQDLAQAARDGDPGWQVLIADEQIAGRGRFERTWVSPAGTSVAASVLLRPDRPALEWGWLSILVGMAVNRAISQLGAWRRSELKWPNDVLVDGKKVCGILCERVATSSGAAAICGWGVNLSIPEQDLPTDWSTSLSLAGVEPDRERLMALTLNRLATLVRRWNAGESLAADYAAECGTLGRQVKVQLDHEGGSGPAVTGLVCGIGDHGELQVRVADQVIEFSAGDVVHLR